MIDRTKVVITSIVCATVCATVLAMAVFIWPTPYHYIIVETETPSSIGPFRKQAIHRVNRFTGSRTVAR